VNPYEHMLSMLRRYHGGAADGERLANEMLVIGYNVVQDFVRLQVGPPWVWSPAMESFYGETDAFVYELLAYHYRPGRRQLREATADEVGKFLPEGGRVLCLGDGIGFDACEIAARNRDVKVVSFEFENATSTFARRLIDDIRLSDHTVQLSQVEELHAGSFDVVVCYDVLEHVPAPAELIRDIARYLKPGGRAFIVEAFDNVEPFHPTHLLSNLKYAGRTIPLFEAAGLRFQGIGPQNFRIFVKGPRTSRQSTAWIRFRQRVNGVRARAWFAYRYGGPEKVDLREAKINGPAFGRTSRGM
jgi:SAM-dependent methyltransferase